MRLKIFNFDIYRGFCGLAVLLFCGVGAYARLAAQQPLLVTQNADQSDQSGVLFAADRQLILQLERAKKYLVEDRIDDGLLLLTDILKSPSDQFYRPANPGPYVSLKSAAREILGQLSGDAKASYELQFTALAEQQLRTALAEQDPQKILDVARLWFYTPAGQTAGWLYARHCLDQGEYLSAALALDRLHADPAARARFDPQLSLLFALCWSRGGHPERALAILDEMRRQHPRGLTLGGQTIAWYATSTEAPLWLAELVGNTAKNSAHGEDWSVFRGRPNRNPNASAGLPLLSPRWRIELLPSAGADHQQTELEQQLGGPPAPTLPPGQLLASGDLILVPHRQQLQGIDFRTGKLIWYYPPLSSTTDKTSGAPIPGGQRQSQLVKAGSLHANSIDEWHVYTLQNPPYNSQQVFPARQAAPVPGRVAAPLARPLSNLLCALSIAKQGALEWQVGGPTGENEPRLANVYFLGAPLPLQRELYILGEVGNELSLYCLAAENGRLIWSQPLLRSEIPLADAPQRQISNLAPSFADGLLICPTRQGVVVGVDVFQRGLAWAATYPTEQVFSVARRRRGLTPYDYQGGVYNRGTEGVAVIERGRVFLGPSDSDCLLCLDLHSGRELWRLELSKQSGEEILYVAEVADERVLVISTGEIHALSAADGSSLWSESLGTGQPSGRGYRAGEAYYLPLDSGEVVKYEIKTGRVLGRSRSRTGQVPGNLIVHRGEILSLSPHGVECHRSLSEQHEWATAALAADPNSAAAWSALGEIQLTQGELGEAIESLKKSWRTAPDATNENLLRESLFAACEVNFDQYADNLPILRAISTDPQHQLRLSQILIRQHLRKSDIRSALGELFALTELPAEHRLQPYAPGTVSLRNDYWPAAFLAEMLTAANPAERETIVKELEGFVAARWNEEEPQAARRWLNILREVVPQTPRALSLAAKLRDKHENLAAELLLHEICETGDEPGQSAAYGQLIQLWRTNGNDAALWRLSREASLANAQRVSPLPPLAEQTVAELRSLPKIEQRENSYHFWPGGPATVDQHSQPLTRYMIPVEIHPQRDLVWAGTKLSFSSQNNMQELICEDGTGQDVFRVNLRDDTSASRFQGMAFTNNMAQARFVGHLLLLKTAFSVWAFDTSQLIDKQPQLLWKVDLTSLLQDDLQNIRQRMIKMPNGKTRMLVLDRQGQPLCGIWLATPELVCIQRGPKLAALDTLTGQTRWVRQGVPPAQEITGDRRALCVYSENSPAVRVIRAADGMDLRTVTVPPENTWVDQWGTRLLISELADARQRMRLLDLAADDTVWQRDFLVNAQARLLEQRECVVYEHHGVLSFLNLKTGETLLESQVHPEVSLGEFQLFRNAERTIAVLGRPHVNRDNRYINGLNIGNQTTLPLSGYVYGISNRSGKQLWEQKVEEVTLLPTQLTETPLILFAANVVEQKSGVSARQYTKLTALDQRTGKIMAEVNSPQPSGYLHFRADPVARTINVQTQGQLVQLRWGDAAELPVNPPDMGK
ncbi:MAG: PQQ-binding-like beta-propeller repeat protein [Pirellulales bacterium]|nr:PQQ-binding-like beta-propeller repeat protein [Pirellulales bacterium]